MLLESFSQNLNVELTDMRLQDGERAQMNFTASETSQSAGKESEGVGACNEQLSESAGASVRRGYNRKLSGGWSQSSWDTNSFK